MNNPQQTDLFEAESLAFKICPNIPWMRAELIRRIPETLKIIEELRKNHNRSPGNNI